MTGVKIQEWMIVTAHLFSGFWSRDVRNYRHCDVIFRRRASGSTRQNGSTRRWVQTSAFFCPFFLLAVVVFSSVRMFVCAMHLCNTLINRGLLVTVEFPEDGGDRLQKKPDTFKPPPQKKNETMKNITAASCV